MDCGPASLKALLEGFGVSISYGRLREACQTDVDGTSIDTLEEVSLQLGLDAEQVMTPKDHVFLPAAGQLPGLLVIVHPDGRLHFVVIWRQSGGYVQVMDPSCGRRWLKISTLLQQTFVHELPVPAEAWREWAGSDDFLRPLEARLKKLVGGMAKRLVREAVADPTWRSLARLDAAARMTAALRKSGGIGSAGQARRLLAELLDPEVEIPRLYWSAAELPDENEQDPQVLLRGAVLLRIRGAIPQAARASEDAAKLSPELSAALSERPARPGWGLVKQVFSNGYWSLLALGAGLVLAAGGVLLEVLLLRGSLEAIRYLIPWEQKFTAGAALLTILAALTLLEFRLFAGLLRVGRLLETKLRVALLQKIPRLNDRYFQSRPISDMASRAHLIHQLRDLPILFGEMARTVAAMGLTVAAIAWLYPHATLPAAIAGAAALLTPLLFHPQLSEQDLRVRTQAGALSSFYLDALLGLAAIRAHVAERIVRREHEGRLTDWRLTARQMLKTAVCLEAVQLTLGLLLAGWVIAQHWALGGETLGALLLAFWALQLPTLGVKLSRLLAMFPSYQSVFLRLTEPLGAIDSETEETGETADLDRSGGAAFTFREVHVTAAGREILRQVNLQIEPGEHIAIVGASGSGKSTLAGLLLGWHRASAGEILADGRPLRNETLAELRSQSAWIDPEVRLWNRSLLENARYGAAGENVGQAITEADLLEVLERLPDGMRTELGEDGGLLSGGEGQRVRLARGLGRPQARLVILDEPFRGLERDRRIRLIERLRRLWSDSTLLFISHDIESSETFPRVLVIEDGEVCEDGVPEVLAAEESSRYHQLLTAEQDAKRQVWENPIWRRLELRAGKLTEL